MSGSVRKTTHINRSFEQIVQWLEADGGIAISHATDVATRAVDDAARTHPVALSFVDPSGVVTARVGAIVRSTEAFAVADLSWSTERPADRLLPNIDAQLLIHAVISSGKQASTAISLNGRFEPHPSLKSFMHSQRGTQQAIDKAASGFLNYLASVMLDELEPPLDRRQLSRAA